MSGPERDANGRFKKKAEIEALTPEEIESRKRQRRARIHEASESKDVSTKDWRKHANITQSAPPPPPAEPPPPPPPLPPEVIADNMRRVRYPVIEQKNADGTSTFRDDPGIRDDARIAAR
jgi:hypothetical protein